MANITRFDPDDTFDDLFRGFWMRPVRAGGQQDVQIKLDVKEDDKAYTVHAEMPGVNKEDIQVSIDGGQVSISAETKKEKEVKEGTRVLRSERHYGKVSRSFSLAQDVDESKAEAHYKDGVLELLLPKQTVSKTRKLTIN
ncbi:Hsp20/alpha crystallin family protein [Accumulibacter sp.]|uniref:Hsp20/alpha crystallin family protein n=1 Tax=Accumulibacter sp. TaxID=2053492 RepID=UPI001D4BED79|nr:Hsp20/alpha crystallin family protein [Accumulibacter sp.]MCB1964696.1 Hsp20/alpha crystallin family protein [Accumulibacter sp.]MCP5227053.1 Hsp20/alpha crystallin family protein [Accumulibacter sp.]